MTTGILQDSARAQQAVCSDLLRSVYRCSSTPTDESAKAEVESVSGQPPKSTDVLLKHTRYTYFALVCLMRLGLEALECCGSHDRWATRAAFLLNQRYLPRSSEQSLAGLWS